MTIHPGYYDDMSHFQRCAIQAHHFGIDYLLYIGAEVAPLCLYVGE